MSDSKFKPSFGIETILSGDLAADSEKFLLFMKAYYEWMQTSKIEFTEKVGTFQQGETIVGATVGATAKIKEIGTSNDLTVSIETRVPFNLYETVTGQTSGATAKISSVVDNVVRRSGKLLDYRNIETSIDTYVDYLREELYPSIPITYYGNKRLIASKFREFFCVICDVNLSKRKLLDRCLHLKRCAKDHQMSTKQLMQFISPDFENEEDDGFIEEIDGPFPRENSKTGGEVINLLSDSEEENFQELKRAQTLPPVKNALSMLMESSRQQNQLYNAGGYSENVQKKSKTLSVVNSTKPRSTKSKDATENPSTETTDVANVTTAPKPSRFNRWNKNNNNQRFGNTAKPGGSNYAPAYKKIQVGDMSYPIIVDGFQFASSLLSECYFLTHFHSDHYTGLSQDFSCGKFFYSQISSSSLSYIGNIYCTPTTASLVKLKLKVATKHLIPLELEKKVSSF